MRPYSLLIILIVAVLVRLSLYATWPMELSGDSASYHALASSLAEGEGYVDSEGSPTSWRPPAYPFFLATLYRVFSPGPWTVRLPQLLLDLGTVVLVVFLGASILGGVAGPVAGLLVALNLGTASASGRLLSETLFTFLLLLALALLTGSLPWDDRKKTSPNQGFLRLGAAGFVFALATLTRGVLLALPFFLAVGLLAREPRKSWWRGSDRWTGSVLPFLFFFVAGIAPWTARNYFVHGAFVPVSTQVGVTLYSSMNPPDGWRMGVLSTDSVVRAARALSEEDGNRVLAEEAFRSLGKDPGRIPRLIALKTAFFLVPLDWEILPIEGAFNPTYAFIAFFAALCPFQRRKRSGCAGSQPSPDERLPWRGGAEGAERDAFWVVPVVLAYFFFMALLFYGSPRMRLPIEPIGALLAGGSLESLYRRRGLRRTALWVGLTAAGLTAAGFALIGAKDLLRSLVEALA